MDREGKENRRRKGKRKAKVREGRKMRGAK